MKRAIWNSTCKISLFTELPSAKFDKQSGREGRFSKAAQVALPACQRGDTGWPCKFTAMRLLPRSLPAQRPDEVQRVVEPRLRAQREALGDAVDQLPVAAGRVQAAFVADVPAPR